MKDRNALLCEEELMMTAVMSMSQDSVRRQQSTANLVSQPQDNNQHPQIGLGATCPLIFGPGRLGGRN